MKLEPLVGSKLDGLLKLLPHHLRALFGFRPVAHDPVDTLRQRRKPRLQHRFQHRCRVDIESREQAGLDKHRLVERRLRLHAPSVGPGQCRPGGQIQPSGRVIAMSAATFDEPVTLDFCVPKLDSAPGQTIHETDHDPYGIETIL